MLNATGWKYTFELRTFYASTLYPRYPKHFVIAGSTGTYSSSQSTSGMTSSSNSELTGWTFLCEYEYTGTNADNAAYTNNPHMFNPQGNHNLTNCNFVNAGSNSTDINGRTSKGYNDGNPEFHIIETTGSSLPLYRAFAFFILDGTGAYIQLKSWNIRTEHSQQIVNTATQSLKSSGGVSVAKTSITPGYNFDVSGNGIFSGTVTASGSILSSDDRVKHNEQPIINALSTISKINPKHYFKTNKLYDASHNFTLNDNGIPISTSGTTLKVNKDYTIETGIIAQDLINISELEFAVMKTNPLGIDYNSIHCTHIAATNELHQIVKTQQTEIQSQQQEIETLKLFNIDANNQINELKQELQNIKQHLGI